MSGVRAELVVSDPGGCPVAAASTTTEGPVTDVVWTASTNGRVTEQFTAHIDGDRDGDEGTRNDLEQVFDYGSQEVYEVRREHKQTEPCPCERVEAEVGPVADVRADDGALRVTVHAADPNSLRGIVTELTDAYGSVTVEYLVQEQADDDESELVPVDLRRLTDRQREVLTTAHEMGYFAYPREANATEVAAALDIQPSTFTEHLNAAQSKLLAELLD